MMDRSVFRSGYLASLLAMCGLRAAVAFADDLAPGEWGFDVPEMFPIESQIEFLQTGDLDGDGLMDLVLSNPRRSEMTLLFNRTGTEEASDSGGAIESGTKVSSINDLPSDARFFNESVMVQSRLKGLHVADLDGDHLPDLLTYDAKNDLMVRWNHKENPWAEVVDWRIDGGLTGQRVLQSADVNEDGLVDLMLMGEQWLALFMNQGERRFDQPKKIRLPNGFAEYAVQDLDGDGVKDLLFHAPNKEGGLLVTFRHNQSFTTLSQIASSPLGQIQWLRQGNDDSLSALGISDQRDQLMVLHLNASNSKHQGDIGLRTDSHYLKFPDFGGVKRGICWADLNGDQQPDCLATDPDAGLIHVYLSNGHGRWDQPRTFPSLTGVQELVSFDWDGDKVAEVFVLSRDENQIGVSKWNSGNQSLSYPERIPGLVNPLVMTSGLHGNDRNLVVLLEKDGAWELAKVDHQFELTTQSFEKKHSGHPERLMEHDMDQDGVEDFIIFTPYEPLACFRRQGGGGAFELFDLSLPGGTWQRGWANVGDLNSDGVADLILPFNNLIRAFKMAPVRESHASAEGTTQWELQVVQQINGPTGNSHLLSGLVLASSGEQTAKVLLLDEAENQLHLALQDSMGVWRIQESQKLFLESGLQLSQLEIQDSGKGPRILCQGKQDALVLDLGTRQPELLSLSSLRSETKNAQYLRIYGADFNGDNQLELFGLESREHAVECVAWGSQNILKPLNRWQVFESRSYRNQGAAFPEPREGLIQDLTGDGLLDFCLIVHDRIILYPQRDSWNEQTSGQ